MDTNRPDDTRSQETDFAAVWSSDGVTRSFAPTATGVPADLPFLFSAGQRFGPYLIVRPIGKGGMGQVYEAEEIDSGRRVAVKILSRGIGDDEERERFLQEGRLAASLSHPNTVYVFGTTEVQGFPVIAMELAPSGTLKDLVVPGKRMPIARAVDAILQVIDGLEAAASLGILHRDVKPSNCFVAARGRVLVGDFGLSVVAEARAGEIPGTVLGTPGFASPEQLRGETLDVRSDIYAVGATIYYLLTGKAPFDDPSVAAMIARVTTEPPPPLALSRPDVPSRFASVVNRCLAKKPGDRYAGYGALRSALEPFRSASLTPAPLLRRFIAGAIDGQAATLPMMPINMYLGAAILDTSSQTTILWATIPTIVVTLAYYTVLEGRFGCGAGKALFNLRVVDLDEHPPGLFRAFLRACVFGLPPQAVRIVLGYYSAPLARPGFATDNAAQSVLAAIAIAVSLAIFGVTFCTARRRNGYAGLHDLASGTRVVVRPRSMAARHAIARTSTAASSESAAGERIGPYGVPSGTREKAAGARTVLPAFDDRLRRHVWLELLPAGTAPLPAWRRDLSRPCRSRWLSGRRDGADCWDAFEAVDGRPFAEVRRVPQPWTRVRHWVADLALEVSAGAVDGSLAPLDEDRLWVAADDRIRLLDWSPVGATAAPSAAADFASAQRFLYGVALGALRGIDPRAAAQEPPAVPLPLSARAFLLKLRDSAFSSPDVLATEASDLLRGAAVFARGRRAAQIAICAFLPVIMPAAVVSAIRVQRNLETSNVRAFEFNACVGQLADYKRRGRLLTAEQKERQRLIEIFIAEYLQDETREAAAVARTFPIITRNRSDHVLAEQAIARHPTRSREDVKRAERVVANLRQLESTSLTQLRTPLAQWGLAVFMTVWSCAFVACLSLVGALLVRGGFTIRGAGAALVTSRGDVAGRPRALWRALVTWLPIVPPLVLIAYGARVQDANLPLVVAQTLSLSILAAGAVWAILRPSHAYQDRIAGTWIVPR